MVDRVDRIGDDKSTTESSSSRLLSTGLYSVVALVVVRTLFADLPVSLPSGVRSDFLFVVKILDPILMIASVSCISLGILIRMVEGELREKKRAIPIREPLKADQLFWVRSYLVSHIKGQDMVIERIMQRVHISVAKLNRRHKPLFAFMFAGPTGSGKTELARCLAKQMMGKKKDVLRLDMNLFNDKHSWTKLVGSSIGYEGSKQGGELTEAIRLNPNLVIIFDEFEKAAREIQHMILNLLDHGTITDGRGNVIDCTRVGIIFTTNARSTEIAALDWSQSAEVVRASAKTLLAASGAFSPELLARLDVLPFRPLSSAQISELLDDKIAKRCAKIGQERNWTVNATESAKLRLRQLADNPAFGVRPLIEALDTDFTAALACAVNGGVIADGDQVLVDYVDQNFVARKVSTA